jgi:hypothetical protein
MSGQSFDNSPRDFLAGIASIPVNHVRPGGWNKRRVGGDKIKFPFPNWTVEISTETCDGDIIQAPVKLGKECGSLSEISRCGQARRSRQPKSADPGPAAKIKCFSGHAGQELKKTQSPGIDCREDYVFWRVIGFSVRIVSPV